MKRFTLAIAALSASTLSRRGARYSAAPTLPGRWNGIGTSTRSDAFRHFFIALARDFTLLRYDARGNGLSDWDVEDVSLDAWVSDLETVVNAAGLERFPLLAMSQGCAISVAFAVRETARHPLSPRPQAGSLTTLAQASLTLQTARSLPPRSAPGLSTTHGGIATGDPGVSPDRTHTGRPP